VQRPARPDSKSDPLYHIEGLPESSVEFERDEPKRRTRRPVIEAGICFEPETGNLDIMSKGGRQTREGIAHSFADRLMGSDQDLQPVHRRDFELDRLKSVMPFPTDPADGIKSVTVTLSANCRLNAREPGAKPTDKSSAEQQSGRTNRRLIATSAQLHLAEAGLCRK
jgi:hypothetical protein